jgi:hypothetical protein
MQVATGDRVDDVVDAFNRTIDVVSKNMTATDGSSNGSSAPGCGPERSHPRSSLLAS